MKILTISILATVPLFATADVYRLKYPTTVDIVEGKEVVGTKRLKAGTLLTLADEVAPHADEPEPAASSSSAKNSKPSNSEMPYKLFMAKRPKTGAWFRCTAELSDYYNYDFEGKQHVYQSIAIKAYRPDGQDYDSASGYIKKSSTVYKHLMDLLKDGNEHLIYGKLTPATNREDDSFTLTEFRPISEN